MPTKIEKDEISGQTTTGHEWDGLKELNTPLPSWWIYTFYVCILWAVVYYFFFPAWPLPWGGHTKGMLGYSARAELEVDVKDLQTKGVRAEFTKKIAVASLADIKKDQKLYEFAITGAKAAFGDNCAACHGSAGQGAVGFPNLQDDTWLFGGTLEEIYKTISFGVRNSNANSHATMMPRFKADGILKDDQISDVADFVLSLNGKTGDAAAVARGKAVFAENCTSCHGDAGEGNQELGAPRLAKAVWIYGGDKKTLVETVSYARAGVMPAWSERLDPATVKMLALYVHSMGGGK